MELEEFKEGIDHILTDHFKMSSPHGHWGKVEMEKGYVVFYSLNADAQNDVVLEDGCLQGLPVFLSGVLPWGLSEGISKHLLIKLDELYPGEKTCWKSDSMFVIRSPNHTMVITINEILAGMDS